jgi:RimJ/RimL family protein N-acetyltransferase
MEVRLTIDKGEIYRFLKKAPDLHLYTIGDLDDFFWPATVWYAIYANGEMQSVALLYNGMTPSTLLLFCEETKQSEDKQNQKPNYSRELLESVRNLLPEKFNVHLSPGLIDVFGKENIIEDYGHNYRMVLSREPEHFDDQNIRRLELCDIHLINSLFKVAYPNNWFDSRMVETGKYFGCFNEGMLVGIAGIHVYSPEYRIAALGNIATHPDFRGRKIAHRLTSVLCCDLKNSVDIIGLNVNSENPAAIKCYENAGFEIRSSFDECFIRNVKK